MALSNYLRIREDYFYTGSKVNFDIYGAVSTSYTVTVTGPTGATVDTFTMTTDSTGVATVTRTASESTWGKAIGTYTGKVTIGSTEYSDTIVYSYKAVLILHGLGPVLDFFQHLEIRDEIGVLNSDRSVARFTYANWNRDYAPTFLKNDKTFVTLWTEIPFDHETGLAYPTGLVQGDEISAIYRWKYFTDSYWGDMLDFVVARVNALKPHTSYSINEAPAEWDDIFLLGTYIRSLEKILLDLNLWRTRVIFPDPSVTQTTLLALLTNARADMTVVEKMAKRRGETSPRVVSSFKQSVPRQISGTNFRNYTILGSFTADSG